jgi:cation-transporting ATPase E
MSRIFVLAILIAAIGLASDGFPITPRQNGIITILTLSIPALCLVLWAKPRQIPRVSLIRSLAHFVIPAVISIVVVGFGVYLFSLITTGDQSYAQTTLTYIIIICGILLIIFVEPPTKWWAGGDVLSGDWRPTLLAIGLLILFFVFLAIPTLREFYGLSLLRQPYHYVVIALAAIIWVFVLRFIWRARLIERYLNFDFSSD